MIEVGDIVRVNVNTQAMTLIAKAKVLNVPMQTGESWQFLDLNSGSEVWTTEPITIYKAATP